MKTISLITYCAVLASIGGCATELGKNLETFNQSVQAKQIRSPAGVGSLSAGFSQNTMSDNGKSAFDAKFSSGTNDKALAARWSSLKPLAEKLVLLSACGVGPWSQNGGQNEIEAWKSIGRWIDPDVRNPYSNGSFPLAIWHTQYHPKSACMNILRIDKWSMPSKNSVSFRVQFISEISNETVFVNYLFKTNEEGTWLYSNATLSP